MHQLDESGIRPTMCTGTSQNEYNITIFQGWAPRSFPFGTFRSFSFFLKNGFFLEFLATFETQKNVPFFSVLF